MQALAFGFTKLVVSDLDAAVGFYRDVFGMKPVQKVTTSDHKYALEEWIMALGDEPPGQGHGLIITRYLQRPAPSPGAIWTGFVVPDLEATLGVLEKAGGAVEVAAHDNPDHGVRAAIAADPEGNLIEIIQLLGASATR